MLDVLAFGWRTAILTVAIVQLPASGIEFDVPLIGYFRLTPEPDAGVVPDVAVAPTIADIAAGHDPAIARAATWLRAI